MNDAGTTALICHSDPRSVCLTSGSPRHKTSTKEGGKHIARVAVIKKAIELALQLLDSRLRDIDAWESEIKRRRKEPELLEELSPKVEPIRRDFIGWFGKDSPVFRGKIRQRILKEQSKFKSLHPYDFISDRKSDFFAYVWPHKKERGKFEGTVHLGSAFWNSKDDIERAGTLIHELSHFQHVGGTDDEKLNFPGINPGKYGETYKYGASYSAYGGSRAARLAISNPSLALENADSFEFFIERRKASAILTEHGDMDTEGLGDFPRGRSNAG